MPEVDELRTLLVQLLNKVDTVLDVQRRQDQRLQHLEDASTTLSADMKTVQQTQHDHTQAQHEHTQTLHEHTQTLHEHTRMLNEHTRILNDQGRALARIDGRLDEQRHTLNALIPVRIAAE